jgi:hypothetical protein
MAVREISKNDAIYSWIRLDLTDHYDVVVRDFATQKN